MLIMEIDFLISMMNLMTKILIMEISFLDFMMNFKYNG